MSNWTYKHIAHIYLIVIVFALGDAALNFFVEDYLPCIYALCLALCNFAWMHTHLRLKSDALQAQRDALAEELAHRTMGACEIHTDRKLADDGLIVSGYKNLQYWLDWADQRVKRAQQVKRAAQ